MSNVVKLKLVDIGANSRVSCNKVLAAAKGELSQVVVLGYTNDGHLYAASSEGAGDTLWIMEHAKSWLLDGCPKSDE